MRLLIAITGLIFICNSCFIAHIAESKLRDKGIEDTYIGSHTNKKRIIVYFEPSIEEILSDLELPYVEDTVRLSCRLIIDVWKKSIVDCKVVEYTDGFQSIEIGSDIRMQIFRNLNIKTKNVHLFNPPNLNIRKERNMFPVSIGIRIIGDEICVTSPNCPPTGI